MNSKQKAYDSYDYTAKMLKISESLYHHQNLYLIKTRKSPYMETSASSLQICKRQEDQVNKYFRNKNDEYIYNKILTISQKPARPLLNKEFISNDKKKKEFNLKMQNMKKEEIERENEEMARRINNLRSFISPRKLDKNFNGEHLKLVKKLQRVTNGKLLLPTLTSRNALKVLQKRNLTEASINKKKVKTEYETIS